MPDRGEQRRDALQRAARDDARRRVVRGARSREERRTEDVLRQRRGEASRHVRSADEGHAEGIDLRLRRRPARRPHHQGGDSRRIVRADPDAGSDRHSGELRRRAEGGIAAGLRGDHGARRHHRHGVARREPVALLSSRVVRQVHAVPRRHRLAVSPAASHDAGQGDREGHPAAAERGQPDQRQDAVRVRRCGGDAGADDAQVVQARVRGVCEGQPARARGVSRAHPGGDVTRSCPRSSSS